MKLKLTESQFLHLDEWFLSLSVEAQNQLISEYDGDQLNYLGLQLEDCEDPYNETTKEYSFIVVDENKWNDAKSKHAFF
jgi:hypothetical protein